MTFPSDFFWGASSSAYQIEGGSREDGKGPSVQDVKQVPEGTPDFTVCSDHYHRYVEDVALFAELGLKSYRFSIAWTRIFPEGTGEVNPKGIEFYNNLINELVSKGITPIATLYHFDLPQALQEQGGWASRATADAFVEFAKVCFKEFGDRIIWWQTINEQNMMTLVPQHVIGTDDLGDYPLYQANHNMFVAQSAAMAACHELLPEAKIGPAPNISYINPLTCDPKDILAAQYYAAVRNWIYLDAAVHGRYNTLALDYIKRAGYSLEVTEEDLEVMRSGKPDFIAFNYYNSETVAYVEGETLVDEKGEIHGPGKVVDNPNLAKTQFSGWPIDPIGFRTTFQEIHSRYNLPMIVTENGLGERDELVDGTVEDDYRIEYLRNHIAQMHAAIETGVPILGYHPWSALDLISTHEGFLKRYGFVYINRTNDDERDLARIKKKSFAWYRKVIDSNGQDLS
ncbi:MULTISPECIES: glycoside hydrolase family 1 protein [unclassified Luteococcus]|uniref:glycoside hydrolase family 1 protein n=1 Tax=unclassified Luteococcus TaxID=2639923 RepID=UPI00313B913A